MANPKPRPRGERIYWIVVYSVAVAVNLLSAAMEDDHSWVAIFAVFACIWTTYLMNEIRTPPLVRA